MATKGRGHFNESLLGYKRLHTEQSYFNNYYNNNNYSPNCDDDDYYYYHYYYYYFSMFYKCTNWVYSNSRTDYAMYAYVNSLLKKREKRVFSLLLCDEQEYFSDAKLKRGIHIMHIIMHISNYFPQLHKQ